MTSKKWNQDAVMKLLQKRKDEDTKGFTDQRFWNPAAPKKGKNVYRVRALPNMAAGGLPWVSVPRHGFQAPSGSWVIENCPSAIHGTGKGVCPFDDYAGPFFNTGDPKDKSFASMIYRKKTWIMNILVIKDSRDGGVNEGKVFLWKFGKKIFEKLDSALFPPSDSGLEQLMFIDPYKGYDLNVVAKMVHDGNKDYPNYDESVFVRDSTPIGDSENKIDEILTNCYDLEGEFLSPKQFKSYEELQKILDTQVINFRKSGSPEPEKKQKKESTPEDTSEPEKKQGKKQDKIPEPEPDSDDEFIKAMEKELNS